MATLDRETRTYQDQLQKMIPAHDGQYVVIQGTQLAHFSDSFEQALEWGYERFGLDRFFVKKVAADQDVAHFTRDLGPCRS